MERVNHLVVKFIVVLQTLISIQTNGILFLANWFGAKTFWKKNQRKNVYCIKKKLKAYQSNQKTSKEVQTKQKLQF